MSISNYGFGLLLVSNLICLHGCVPGGNAQFDMPKGYVVAAGSANDVSIRPKRAFTLSEPHVAPKVVAIGFDDRFILAKQHPLRAIGDSVVANGGRIQRVEVDHGVTNYWILDTAVPQLYGPFPIAEFRKQRTALSVPPEIEMKTISR